MDARPEGPLPSKFALYSQLWSASAIQKPVPGDGHLSSKRYSPPLAFLILFFTGLSLLTGDSGSINQFGSFVAVLFFVFGAYGTALDIIELLDLLIGPVRPTSAHSYRWTLSRFIPGSRLLRYTFVMHLAASIRRPLRPRGPCCCGSGRLDTVSPHPAISMRVRIPQASCAWRFRSLLPRPLIPALCNYTGVIMEEFSRIQRLPPYVFNITDEMKRAARRRGEDIIDFGMGNPDGATPKHIVDKLVEAALKPATHRYSVSRGIPRLRKAICNWYKTRYDVDLDPDTEAIVTIGSKEGIAHLCLAILDSRDTVLVPNPSYPIHIYGPVIAGAHVVSVPVHDREQFLAQLEDLIPRMTPRPKALIVNFPSNPTTECVDLPFLARLVELAREYGFHLIHDLAYADIAFDGYKPPSVLEVPGAKDVAVEFFTLSQELQHARLARGLHGGQPGAGRGAGAAQELLRLRHIHADPGCVHSGARRPAGVRRRDLRELPQAPRRAGRGAEQAGLAGGAAQGHHVCVGADSRGLRSAWARWSFQSCC